MPSARASEIASAAAIIGEVFDNVRKLNDEMAKELPPDWVALYGPHPPLEELKHGMICVHREYQTFEMQWRKVNILLRTKQADSELLEDALIQLAASASKFALDLTARRLRQEAMVNEELFELAFAD